MQTKLTIFNIWNKNEKTTSTLTSYNNKSRLYIILSLLNVNIKSYKSLFYTALSLIARDLIESQRGISSSAQLLSA